MFTALQYRTSIQPIRQLSFCKQRWTHTVGVLCEYSDEAVYESARSSQKIVWGMVEKYSMLYKKFGLTEI